MRFGIAAAAASLALVSGPAAAQDAVAITPAPPAEGAVGPVQLRDFNLDGTVIRRSEPAAPRTSPAAEAPTSPVRQQGQAAVPAETRARPAADRPATSATPSGERRVEERRNATGADAVPPERRASASQALDPAGTMDLPPPSPASPLFSPAPALPDLPPSSGAFEGDGGAGDAGGFPILPWLFALLMLAGGAYVWFRRKSSAPAFAGAPEVAEFAPAVPEQLRSRRSLEPAPAPAPPAPPAPPTGIVSTRLRPALNIQFRPDRVIVDETEVRLEFEIAVANSGSGPARDLLVEAAMFNAGADQEAEIRRFFERPVGQGERVPLIAPLKSLGFRSAVAMTRERVRQFKAGDRTVFVPLIGFNLLYRSSDGEGQVSTSYLVGADGGGEKLAPLRPGEGQRQFTVLGARELDIRFSK